MKLVVALTLLALVIANVIVEREECKDDIKHCTRLAESEDGCNPEKSIYKYMAQSCKLTCGICTASDTPTCTNELTDEQCGYLVNQGACDPDSRFYNYMIPNCQKSCGECAADEQDISNCNDVIDSSNCQQFINGGGSCSGNRYLLANCEKTCGMCDAYDDDSKYCVDALVGNGKYLDPTENCANIQKVGWCDESSAPAQFYGQIVEGCRKTCDFC